MNSTRWRRPRRRAPRWGLAGLVLAAWAWVWIGAASPASAADEFREKIRTAHQAAMTQFGELELEAAQATLEGAITEAQGAGRLSDPILAPLLVLRGGIVYSNTGNKAATLAAFTGAIAADYNVVLPIELRSKELQSILDEARTKVQRPSADPVLHDAPKATRDEALQLEALSGVPLVEGSQMVLYWRSEGETDYRTVSMDRFGNLAEASIPAAEHANKPIEYFIYAFDGEQNALANKGQRDAPLKIEFAAAETKGGGGPPPKGKKKKKKRKRGKGTGLPRVFINFGVGTGFGVARGTAEQTFEQYTPANFDGSYTTREQSCALSRWLAGGAGLEQDPLAFQQTLDMVGAMDPSILPDTSSNLASAYDPGFCGRHHPVTTGIASAPFHLAPEVAVHVGANVVIGVFTRLQVVTGSRVIRDDPGKPILQSFQEDLRSTNPDGIRVRPPFTWAIGTKIKYFFGKDEDKFRVFAGAFGGFGNARLRVNMGFSNDRNGNSVPDRVEVAATGLLNTQGQIMQDTCVPVWPYNRACVDQAANLEEEAIATAVSSATSATDARVDTVKIGPGFLGALVGFNYQVVKHFAIFAELNVGGWFPSTSSVLFDLNLGPAVTF